VLDCIRLSCQSVIVVFWIAGSEPVFKNKKILLLEAAAQRKQHQLPESFNSRVCALNGGTVQLLESMFV